MIIKYSTCFIGYSRLAVNSNHTKDIGKHHKYVTDLQLNTQINKKVKPDFYNVHFKANDTQEGNPLEPVQQQTNKHVQLRGTIDCFAKLQVNR